MNHRRGSAEQHASVLLGPCCLDLAAAPAVPGCRSLDLAEARSRVECTHGRALHKSHGRGVGLVELLNVVGADKVHGQRTYRAGVLGLQDVGGGPSRPRQPNRRRGGSLVCVPINLNAEHEEQ